MKSLARAAYRTRQGLHALRPRLDPADLATVHAGLSDGLAALFFAMERRDQRHALEVARRLGPAGAADPDLLAAALLHDCGKGAVPVWLRVVKVLSPALLRRFARERGGWRGAAWRLQHHAAIGARLAAAAGAGPATVRLIAGTTEPDDAARRALLQAADDAS